MKFYISCPECPKCPEPILALKGFYGLKMTCSYIVALMFTFVVVECVF